MTEQITTLRVNQTYLELVPRPNSRQYTSIKQSIRDKQQLEPITINQDGVIIDGYTRFQICDELNIVPKTITRHFESKDEEITFLIESNLSRRHLSDVQRYELAKQILPLERKLAKQRQREAGKYGNKGCKKSKPLPPNDGKGSNRHDNESLSKACKKVQLSPTKYRRLDKILKSADEQVKEKVRNGDMSIGTAYITVNRRERKRNAPPIPNGKFSIIIADLPYLYKHGVQGSPELHYGVESFEELCELGKKMPFADDAKIYLWTTSAKLKEGIQVLESWGFRYVTFKAWIKQHINGMGYHGRQNVELILVGVKGKFEIPEPEDLENSGFITEAESFATTREGHSVKPDKLYEIVEKEHPDMPYLELFARRGREGWVSWGDEL